MFSANPTTEDIFRARLFEEPLVPVGSDPTPDENSAVVAAVLEYSKRTAPDDFSGLTDFLEANPNSPWNAALLTNLGLECYHTGHYSKALGAWSEAWRLARTATDLRAKALADRAVGELAYMHARVGRMAELDTLLDSVEDRVFGGPATERICGAREGRSNMRHRPETAFRCGPLALYQIKLTLDAKNPGIELIHAAASTQQGFSLWQLQELSQKLGLHFRMAYREKGAAFIVPSIVHLKLNHYAAMVRREGDRYLLQDPTFRNDLWVTQAALDAETSGYFLIPRGKLAEGWRAVDAHEGTTVHGKGSTNGPDPDPHGPCDPHTSGGNSCDKDDNDCKGMAVPRVHLLLVSLNINDEPIGYSPPVGPAIRFTVRYNQREARQSANLNYSNMGPKWTFDWFSYITDKPSSPLNNVTYYIMGGGTRTFTGFDGTKTFAFQQLDQTKLTRTSPAVYEMVSRDGTTKIFSKAEDIFGQQRRIYLTQLIDPFGNAVSLAYDAAFRVISITDAIGQITTISYGDQFFNISKVTDPFGRVAMFDYDSSGRLIKITDVSGITSEFTYDAGDFIKTLTTPYGDTTFTKTGTDDPFFVPSDTDPFASVRSLETVYPDGTRDRVEFNQNQDLTGIFDDPADSVPGGMRTRNLYLSYRNTFYWSRQACAYAYGDYSKATLYHWLHTVDLVSSSSASILESVKEPLEGRVWYDYAGQSPNDSQVVGSSNRPEHVGRVLDDGSTQLYTYEYNDFGHATKMIDPVGRTFSYRYADNGIDLLEIRQTRAGQNELLSKITYNGQHQPLTKTDAAGQTTTYTYNASGHVLAETNARNETTTYNYDNKGFSIPVNNGFLTSIDGPLPGASITFTYDAIGRVQSRTNVDGYTLSFEYDSLDRLTKITYPDSTFDQFTYDRLDRKRPLDLTLMRDRAGRQTSFEYDTVRQMTKRTDPLNRETLFQWCKCGALKRLTDPMGRSTTWRHDVQGRVKCKEYADGSQVNYLYETSISRLRHTIDEQLQVTQHSYNRDNTISAIVYTNVRGPGFNPKVPTPPVFYTYDPNYSRLSSMVDGVGTTLFTYYPITSLPQLGAGKLASTKGGASFTETITYSYDELGRRVFREINGVGSLISLDAGGRATSQTNALGTFVYGYKGPSRQLSSARYPNGLTATFEYFDNIGDLRLKRITHAHGSKPISEFGYDYNVPTGQITSWSQRLGANAASVMHALDYDDANQLKSMDANTPASFAYTYDPAGNRLTEQHLGITRQFSYDALNRLTTADPDPETVATFHFDAAGRLSSVRQSNRTTIFTYDGLGRTVGIRDLQGGAVVSDKSYVWSGSEICEERDELGISTVKRFFPQGTKVETGARAGSYFYTKDHQGSVRQLIDETGNPRGTFFYSPFGDRGRLGSVDSDFGFTGHFFHAGTSLCLTMSRAYDPKIARWLSRDPSQDAEMNEGVNLYVYVGNNPINLVDPSGLSCTEEAIAFDIAVTKQIYDCYFKLDLVSCLIDFAAAELLAYKLWKCQRNGWDPPPPPPPPCGQGQAPPSLPTLPSGQGQAPPSLPTLPTRCVETAPGVVVCF